MYVLFFRYLNIHTIAYNVFPCREAIYLKGGVLFITSRIIVMDLLKKICPVEKVLGILVYRAHK